MQRLEFAFGRTALTYGLRALGLHSGDVILVPDSLCDVVWLAVRKIDVRVVTYPVTDALTPDWDALTTNVRCVGARALLMVHYFGQPQEIDRFRSFCDENGLWLVEDNAHGYSGTWHGQLLGTVGDIGIASPRKITGTASGGVLYCNGDSAPLVEMRDLPVFPAMRPFRLARTALGRFPKIKSRIRGFLNLSKNWSDPRVFLESETPDYAIDPDSRRLIASADWQAIAHQRRSEWLRWSAFALRHGLVPVFSAVHPESCPWALPVYAKDLDERNRWLRWGARHGVTLFPWPSLPDEMINEGGVALARWERLLCFSLDRASA